VLICLRHDWKVVGVERITLYPHGRKDDDLPVDFYTVVKYVCRRCRRARTSRLDGHWTPEMVLGEAGGRPVSKREDLDRAG
jgi:hypothetical protein